MVKINEVVKTDDQLLYEAIDPVNDTGVNTADLVKIAKAQKSDEWTQHNTANDFFKHLEKLEA